MFITLLELDRAKPYSRTYKFKVQVYNNNFSFSNSLINESENQDLQIIAEEKEELIVTLEAPDDQGYFWIQFSNNIRLPADCTEWTNTNDGK